MRMCFILSLCISFASSHASGSEAIKDLVSQLGNSDSEISKQLVGHGEKAIPYLAELVKQKTAPESARIDAALTLGKIGGVLVIEPLITVLQDKRIAWAAIKALKDVGEPATPAIPELAKIATAKTKKNSDEEFFSELATEAIAQIGRGNSDALEVLRHRMVQKDDRKTALLLTHFGAGGAEALVEFATKYLADDPLQGKRKYAEAYSVLAWGNPPLPPEMIPVFEKYIVFNDERAVIASLALAGVGLPAKPLLIRLLDHENADVRAHAAEGLATMNFFAGIAREYRGEKVEDPVASSEVFPKLKAISQDQDGKPDMRIFRAMIKIDSEATLALPEYRKAIQDIWNKNLQENAESSSNKYTVWVFKRVNGKWIKDDNRTYIGDRKTAQEYSSKVMRLFPQWRTTSNLPTED